MNTGMGKVDAKNKKGEINEKTEKECLQFVVEVDNRLELEEEGKNGRGELMLNLGERKWKSLQDMQYNDIGAQQSDRNVDHRTHHIRSMPSDTMLTVAIP